MGFPPLDPVEVLVGRMVVKWYPKIVSSMPAQEHVHAFQVNMLTLKDLPTNLQLVIDVFGVQVNASLTIKGILSNWRHFFQEHWMILDTLQSCPFITPRAHRWTITLLQSMPRYSCS